jgi:intracellular septation protein
MVKAKALTQFLFSNFGPILVFYFANHFWGLKIAVGSSIIWTAGELIYNKINKRKTTVFFLFAAAITVGFGLIDLYLQQTLFFKYEASLTSFVVGVYFATTLLGEKTLIQEFAQSQGRVGSEITLDQEYYFRFLTVTWALYQFAKAGAYFWLASRVSLEEGLVIRAILGNATFYLLLAASIFGAKTIKGVLGNLKMLPSTRI